MTDSLDRAEIGETNSVEETETEPVENIESENNLEWRFDIDFRLNPDWLRNPRLGNLPLPLSVINDWIRNNIQRSDSQLESTTSPTSSLANQNMRNNSTAISSDIGTRAVSDTSIENNSVVPRISTRAQGTSISEGEHGTEYTPSPASSRRSSRPIVIDLTAEPPSEWPSAAPAPESNDRNDEAHSDTERSAADIIRQSPEARIFLGLLQRYLPFIFILLLKGILDHGSGITVFFALMVTFSHADRLIRKEVTKQGKRSLPYLLMIVVNLFICIFCLYYVFQDERLYPALFFLPTDLSLSSIHSLFWLVLVTDYVVKFITVILKCGVIMLPERAVPFQKRGKYYLFIESSSQLYRCLLPIHPWIYFLFTAYDGSLKIFSVLLCLLYIICKTVDVAQRFNEWKVALKKFLAPVHYGTVPTPEELSDLFCPICHDSFSSPTKLCCGHIFCEDCVSTWLDRGERSCPMCRARVVQDTSWRNGGTSHFIQIF